MKPYKGKLANVYRAYIPDQTDNLGYYYRCNFVDHPYLRDEPGTMGNTSMIVKEVGDEIETLNSLYTIVSRMDVVAVTSERRKE